MIPKNIATILALSPAKNISVNIIANVTIVVDKSGSLIIKNKGTAARPTVISSLLGLLISSSYIIRYLAKNNIINILHSSEG